MEVFVIVFVLGALAVLIFKRPSSCVYYLALVDIFLRIIDYIVKNIPSNVVSDFLVKYLPTNVNSIIQNYTSGIFETVLLWLFLGIYVVFLYYTVCVFLKKK